MTRSTAPTMVAEEETRAQLYRQAADEIAEIWPAWVKHCEERGEEDPGRNVWERSEQRLRLAAEHPERVPRYEDLQPCTRRLVHQIADCRTPLPLEVFAYWLRPGDRMIDLSISRDPVLIVGVMHSRGRADLRVLTGSGGPSRRRTLSAGDRVWVVGVDEVQEQPVEVRLPGRFAIESAVAG